MAGATTAELLRAGVPAANFACRDTYRDKNTGQWKPTCQLWLNAQARSSTKVEVTTEDLLVQAIGVDAVKAAEYRAAYKEDETILRAFLRALIKDGKSESESENPAPVETDEIPQS